MNNLIVAFICLTLSASSYGLKDCPQGHKDEFGCKKWKKEGHCENDLLKDFMQGNCKAACGYCKALPPGPPVIKNVPVSQYNCLLAHNSKRRLHGVPNLEWSSSLEKEATKWALYLAKEKKAELVHAKGNFGENLFGGTSSPKTILKCKDAVEAWYGEIKDYNWNNPGFSSATGHFTQVVWRDSVKLGVGRATLTKDGETKTVIVARYSPSGNVIGQFRTNVPRKMRK